jgi:carboxypeptidase C (cathepsin A)
MQAILNRKDEKFVNPVPLREVYNVILKLPARTKFESFLASSGCSDKLSVSETFFYLQKFMQIHPLRTTQIEFEKSIEEFYNKHQRQFLKGVKKWPKPSIQKFANYIRSYNIDLSFLQEPGKTVSKTVNVQFCTRERLQEYF